MPYSLLGENNAEDPDHARYGGFLARMEPSSAKPSAITHLRWLGLGILIGCTLLTVYQFIFVSDAPEAQTAANRSATSEGASTATGNATFATDDSRAGNDRASPNERADGPAQTAVITQGRTASPEFADSMSMMAPDGTSASDARASDGTTASAASEADGANDAHGSIGDDYPTALLAGSLQLSEPSLQSSSPRRSSNVSNDDPDVAILQLLLQRIDKKE
ncbi:MAG: hypothetical protein CMN27_13675 [Salinisphaera sp.]|nr:hypothetical protein [Salinisphaera sp.]